MPFNSCRNPHSDPRGLPHKAGNGRANWGSFKDDIAEYEHLKDIDHEIGLGTETQSTFVPKVRVVSRDQLVTDTSSTPTNDTHVPEQGQRASH